MEPVSIVQPKLITLKEVKANPKVRKLIDGANEVMKAMGYTEHGHRHVGVVSGITGYILENLTSPAREIELGQIAAYLHDIGNVVNRVNHPMIGGAIAFTILNEMGMDAAEIAPVLGAIGNHEELAGVPVSTMSAALIIADKSDVHFSRVQNPILESFDIHDRVNYAVEKSFLNWVRSNTFSASDRSVTPLLGSPRKASFSSSSTPKFRPIRRGSSESTMVPSSRQSFSRTTGGARSRFRTISWRYWYRALRGSTGCATSCGVSS